MRQQLCYFSLHEQSIRLVLQFSNTEIPMVFLKKYVLNLSPVTCHTPLRFCVFSRFFAANSSSPLESGRSTGLLLQQKGSTFTKNLHAKA